MIKAHKIFLSLCLSVVSFSTLAGNGAPTGSHYNLNIIGVSKNKSASLTKTDQAQKPIFRGEGAIRLVFSKKDCSNFGHRRFKLTI
jgi:hypothetical protein